MPPVYPQTVPTSTLFYGDNLAMLRAYIADASIALVYFDPPSPPPDRTPSCSRTNRYLLVSGGNYGRRAARAQRQ